MTDLKDTQKVENDELFLNCWPEKNVSGLVKISPAGICCLRIRFVSRSAWRRLGLILEMVSASGSLVLAIWGRPEWRQRIMYTARIIFFFNYGIFFFFSLSVTITQSIVNCHAMLKTWIKME